MNKFCSAVTVVCPYGCGKKFIKSELDDHTMKCELRLTKCEYCAKEIPMVEITQLVSA